MPTPHRPLPDDIARRAVFLAWGPPAYTMRTRLLAAQLGIEVRHVFSTRRRGLIAAPMKYSYQTVATIWFLLRHRPTLVFVQSPPSLAVLVVGIYARLTKARFVIDAHSDAFMSRYWSRPEWLHRWLARGALATIATNQHFADITRRRGGQPCVVRDIPGSFEHSSPDLGPDFNVAVVATFAPDEPIDEIVEAARSLPDARFRITGDVGRSNASIPSELPDNVELTGFLPSADYYGLLHSSDAVMVLTTRDHTMQRGACEALALGTPIITSDWSLLVDYFRKGTVHVDNSAAGIARGVTEMRNGITAYRDEILELRDEVESEWMQAQDQLLALITGEDGR